MINKNYRIICTFLIIGLFIGVNVGTGFNNQNMDQNKDLNINNKESLFDNIPAIDWNKTYGLDGNDYILHVSNTHDGGFIATGGTASYGGTDVDLWLIRTDVNGNELWNISYGGNKEDFGIRVFETQTGDFVILGSTESYGTQGSSNFWLLKTDYNGDLLWSHTWGTERHDTPNDLIITSDNYYLFTGGKTDASLHTVWLFKTDENGNKLWDKKFGSGADDYDVDGLSLCELSSGQYIIAGYLTRYLNPNNNCKDVWLIKTDNDGNKLWDKNYGGNLDDAGYDVCEMYDNNLIIVGRTKSFSDGYNDIWLLKTNANGDIIWHQSYGDIGDDKGRSVHITSDNGFILTGYTNSIGAGGYDGWIIRTDNLGNEIWNETYGGSNDDYIYYSYFKNDTNAILTGSTSSFGLDNNDAWLIKLKENFNPVSDFTYNPTLITTLDDVSFVDLSYDPDGYITNWSWNFGDGNISFDQHPIYHFTQSGDYNVCLTVEDNIGENDTFCSVVTVYDIDAGITESNIHDDDSRYIGNDQIIVNFSNQGDLPLNITVHFILEIENMSAPSGWDEIQSGSNGPYDLDPDVWIESFFDVFYARIGEYRATFELEITYNDEPLPQDSNPENDIYQAVFNVIKIPVILNDLDDGDWNWSVVYSDSISINIDMRQFDGDPLQDQSEKPKTVYLEYFDGILWNGVFNDTLNDPNDQNTTLEFNFTVGDNQSVDILPGNYSIRFRFDGDDWYPPETENGKLEIINNPPIANFTFLPLNPSTEDDIQFIDLSTDEEGEIISWWWDFGDGYFSNSQNPIHQYDDETNYTVCLTVEDTNGMIDTLCQNISVENPVIIIDVNQSLFDRGFPIRHAADGDWAAAQSFTPTLDTLTSCEIYMRKFGVPEFNLTVNLRTDHPQGPIIDTLIFTPEELPSSWTWWPLDFNDTLIVPDTEYFIVCPPAPSGVTTSFGYEWGYAFGNQYDGGAFWFTRDGGALWRDLPTSYEFVFRTYGYD